MKDRYKYKKVMKNLLLICYINKKLFVVLDRII